MLFHLLLEVNYLRLSFLIVECQEDPHSIKGNRNDHVSVILFADVLLNSLGDFVLPVLGPNHPLSFLGNECNEVEAFQDN